MNKEEKNQLFLRIVSYGCAQFIIITILAMFVYPGGTLDDPNTKGYIFYLNMISDLGVTVSYSGVNNMFSHLMFTICATLAGIGLIPFFITMPKYFKSNKWEKYISIVTSSFACLFSLTYIGIALTPANLFYDIHMIFVGISFLGTFPVIFIYTILMFCKRKIPRYLGFVFLFFSIISILYIISGYISLKYSINYTLMFTSVSQKIIIYTEMSSMVIVGQGMAKYSQKLYLEKLNLEKKLSYTNNIEDVSV